MRLTRLRRTILSLLGVFLAYGLYAVCVVPFVEPHPSENLVAEESPTDASSTAADPYVRELTPLFPEGSWELNHPKVLRSNQATILLQEFDQLDDGRLHVRPCTIVLYESKRKSDEAGPTIMQAPQGAILAFDEPLDLASGKFGKPVSGKLVGGIRIVRVGSKATEDLELVTSNVEISGKQIWTPDQVSFRIGNATGSGNGLLITRAESTAKKDVSSKLIEDLGTIEMQHVQQLSFVMEQDDLFDSFSANDTPTTSRGIPVKIEVGCQGPMIFDLIRMKATLEDQVTIARQEQGQRPDTLYASNLSMYFSRRKIAAKDDKTANESKPTLEMTRLVAEGKPLIIDAKSKHAFLEGKRLEYDFVSRTLKLFGSNPFASSKATAAPTSQVRLKSPKYQVASAAIEFHNNEDRRKWELHAEGAGSFVGSLDGRSEVNASWSQQLSLVPRQSHQVLQLKGDAQVRTAEAGTIAADVIELWLRQVSKHTSTRLDGTPVIETTAIPIKLATQSTPGQSIKIESAYVSGALEGMEIFFQPNPHPAPAGRGFRQSLQPSTTTSPQSAGGTQTKLMNTRYTVKGGALSAWVDPDTRELHRMIVKGHSRILEQATAGQRPFQLEGSMIDLAFVGGVPVAHLTGSPANIGSPELDVTGDRIEFDGTRNVIHIPGPGSLTIQTTREFLGELNPQSTAVNNVQQGSSRAVSRPTVLQPIHVAWQQGLHFDGQVVGISGGVKANGEDLSFLTEDLKLTLAEVIDLSDLNVGKVRPKLKFVNARGSVSAAVKSRDDRGTPKSFQQVSAQDLNVDFTSGDVVANGPGRISFTSPDKLFPSIRPVPKATEMNAASAELSLLSVAFQTQLQGNMERHEVHLHENVRMWMGPSGDWHASVDPTERPMLRKDDVWMSCNELFVIESPSAAPTLERKPIELLARGEAYVEGQLYAAKGHQIKYAQEKDMLTLEGDANRPAQLWQRNSPNEKGTSQGRVRRIRFSPKSKKLVLDGYLRFDISATNKSNAK